MTIRWSVCFALLVVLTGAGTVRAQAPLGTAFTYQGRLSDGGTPPTGAYDLQFRLFDTATVGTQVGGTVTLPSVGVTGGLFTVKLDFGASAFTGSARWLEVGVRPGGSPNPFTILSPRQELTPTPDAIFSSATPWSGVMGKPAGFADDIDNDSGGDITGVTAGSGLTGGGSTGNVTLAADFPPADPVNGTATMAARSDHTHAGAFWETSVPSSFAGFTLRVVGGGPGGMAIQGWHTLADSAGVVGVNTHFGPGTSTGVLGRSDSDNGIGVSGSAGSPTGSSTGVAGRVLSPDGYGGYFVGGRGIGFQDTDGQMINLGASGARNYGLGVQTLTAYSRSAGGFAWYRDGSPSPIQNDPGPGGTVLMTLTSTGALTAGSATLGGFRLTTAPTPGFVLTSDASGNGTWQAAAGDVTGVTAGAGLTGGGTSGSVTLAVDTAVIQSRVTGACAPGSSIRVVNGNGSVACQPDTTGNDWSLFGNAGTNPAVNFIGTTDDQALNFQVNGSRAFRLEPGLFGDNNVIGGASTNVVDAGTFGATICGGGQTDPSGRNRVTSLYGTVCGGAGNTAGNIATVAGGGSNTASGTYAMIPGGHANKAGGWYSFAAGRRAVARDPSQSLDSNGDEGTFVWADSTDADFASTGPNQFLVRAGGGVGINLNNPSTTLDVAGGIRGSASAGNGVQGLSTDVTASGVYGQTTAGYGVAGRTTAGGIAIFGDAVGGLAGQFNGDVVVVGNLSKGGGSFRIDHPLDPRNKYLSHSFVESPDMMDIYNGNVTTGADGFATVELPEWFEALNRDFRYQLTVVGAGAWARARVAREIQHNRFVVETDVPGTRVSWQVTGIRQDAWAEKHRIRVEEDKPHAERGRFLHPEAFGAEVRSSSR